MSQPSVKVVYCYPIIGDAQYLDLALRFLKTYHEYPAGFPHESLVVCNGGEPNDEVEFMFGAMENVRLMHHDNSGRDIGAFQHAARDNPCDLMLFFGATAYIRGAGWLARVVESWMKRGDTLYGVMGNRGVISHGVHPHIRTTGMWISPALFNQYPYKVTDPSHRYPFEHGPECLTGWITRRGKIPYVVSWSGEWNWNYWDSFPRGWHRGDQGDMIFGDRMSCPPYHPCP